MRSTCFQHALPMQLYKNTVLLLIQYHFQLIPSPSTYHILYSYLPNPSTSLSNYCPTHSLNSISPSPSPISLPKYQFSLISSPFSNQHISIKLLPLFYNVPNSLPYTLSLNKPSQPLTTFQYNPSLSFYHLSQLHVIACLTLPPLTPNPQFIFSQLTYLSLST